jgi:hypothetical protein
MSPQNTLKPETAKKLVGLSLLLGALPAFTFAVFRWLVFGDLFALGMYRSAYFYLRSALNDDLTLWLFAAVLVGVSVIYGLLAWLGKDEARASRMVDYVFIAAAFALLLVTGYQLNRTSWFPDLPSIRAVIYNSIIVLEFSSMRGSPGFLRI